MAIAGLSARIYSDHNIDLRIAKDLRRHGFDAVAAQELGLRTASDETHLTVASESGRAILTHDFADFSTLAAEWYESGRTHYGIIFAQQPPLLPYADFLERLLVLLNDRTQEELINLSCWV